MKERGEFVLRGVSISKGIGIGFPVLFSREEEIVSHRQIPPKEIEEEIHRYRVALDLSRKDLEALHKTSLRSGSTEVVAILGTHLEIMQDPLITVDIEQKIREKQQNTERVFYELVEEYKERFHTLDSGYFQERIRDIIDISRRILGHLQPFGRLKIADIPHNAVIIAHELVPSETIEANASLISAFVTEAGGVTSHAAIIARAKGIPYVANIDLSQIDVRSSCSLIVDGSQGIVIVNPSKLTLRKYQELKKQLIEGEKALKNTAHLRIETIDGYEVRLFANLENPKEVSFILRNGASGIGLFRSEYLCLSKEELPSEEEQFEIYKKMVKALKGRPLVVRVFDLGGDKKINAKEFCDFGIETNPAFGCRAIRWLLKFPYILRQQLRAILRASKFGEVHVLIPMVSDVDELRQVRQMIVDLQAELKREGWKTAREIPVGCMIEVPSAAMMCDAIAEEADFLSIGTNDLVQYVLAADRTNPHLSGLCSDFHPSVLRLIRSIVSAASMARKPVIVCGEIAADPMMIPILLGLGISEFSVSVRHIPLVKNTIRKWRLLEAYHIAEKALKHGSARELKKYLQEETAQMHI